MRFELALSVGWSHWPRILEIEKQIDSLEAASYRELLTRFGVAS